ncbi:MAG: hypothetical protein ACLQVY_00465 [Limisphaerales bacterium]
MKTPKNPSEQFAQLCGVINDQFKSLLLKKREAKLNPNIDIFLNLMTEIILRKESTTRGFCFQDIITLCSSQDIDVDVTFVELFYLYVCFLREKHLLRKLNKSLYILKRVISNDSNNERQKL